MQQQQQLSFFPPLFFCSMVVLGRGACMCPYRVEKANFYGSATGIKLCVCWEKNGMEMLRQKMLQLMLLLKKEKVSSFIFTMHGKMPSGNTFWPFDRPKWENETFWQDFQPLWPTQWNLLEALFFPFFSKYIYCRFSKPFFFILRDV